MGLEGEPGGGDSTPSRGTQGAGLRRGPRLPEFPGPQTIRPRPTLSRELAAIPPERPSDRVDGNRQDLPGLRPGPEGVPQWLRGSTTGTGQGILANLSFTASAGFHGWGFASG